MHTIFLKESTNTLGCNNIKFMHPSVFVGPKKIIHLINARNTEYVKVIGPFVPVGRSVQMFIIRFVLAEFNLNTSVLLWLNIANTRQ